MKMQRIALFRRYSETKRESEGERETKRERERERETKTKRERVRDSDYLGRVVVEGFLHVCDISSAKRCSVHTTCRVE